MAGHTRSTRRRIWQTLSAVRTGIILLILVVIASAAGTFILQRPTTKPDQIQRAYSPQMLAWLDRLGLTDVFHAWWFVVLMSLVCLTIVAASIERFPNVCRFFARPYRRPDSHFRGALPIQRQISVSDSEQALAAAHRVFQKQGLRPQHLVEDNQLSLFAERNRFSLLAVYIVHASLLLIFLGGIVDAVWGYRGFLALTNGQQASQIQLQNGTARTLPFAIRCDGAGQENYSDGTPKRWWSNLVVVKDGREAERKQIVVNDPLVYGGIRIYQSSYGSTGQLDKVMLTATPAKGSGAGQDISLGQDETAQLDPQTSVRLARFIPDFVVQDNQIYARSNQPDNPAIQLEVTSKKAIEPALVWIFPQFPNVAHDSKSPYNFKFRDLRMGYFTGLQVSHEPGQWLVWAGCLVMALGLFTAFYLVHMRFWAMVVRDEQGRPALWIGGACYKNRAAFELRFRKLVEEVQTELKQEESQARASAREASLASV
ncbi:MAG TPA: cytochrome c biogenesis protein ResB [Terriglobales bacterium]|nr:cytochrome c biogenesis protein ResB [Terriglobales bacterium]